MSWAKPGQSVSRRVLGGMGQGSRFFCFFGGGTIYQAFREHDFLLFAFFFSFLTVDFGDRVRQVSEGRYMFVCVCVCVLFVCWQF